MRTVDSIPFIYSYSAHPYALNVNPGQHNGGRKKKEGTSEGTEETHSRRSKRNEIVTLTPHLAVSPLASSAISVAVSLFSAVSLCCRDS